MLNKIKEILSRKEATNKVIINSATDMQILSIERPVVVDGEILFARLNEKVNNFEESIVKATDIINTEYKSCLQGTAKADKKRQLQKELHDIQVKKLWLSRLKDVVTSNYKYALTIQEAILLGFIDD